MTIETMVRRRVAMAACVLIPALVAVLFLARPAEAQRGRGALGTVYVTSQGLYFDTFVSAQKLPPHGPFQLLVNGTTAFGPGDPGYVGGRWQVPNGSGGYDYFLCPLLGPGRATP